MYNSRCTMRAGTRAIEVDQQAAGQKLLRNERNLLTKSTWEQCDTTCDMMKYVFNFSVAVAWYLSIHSYGRWFIQHLCHPRTLDWGLLQLVPDPALYSRLKLFGDAKRSATTSDEIPLEFWLCHWDIAVVVNLMRSRTLRISMIIILDFLSKIRTTVPIEISRGTITPLEV